MAEKQGNIWFLFIKFFVVGGIVLAIAIYSLLTPLETDILFYRITYYAIMAGAICYVVFHWIYFLIFYVIIKKNQNK